MKTKPFRPVENFSTEGYVKPMSFGPAWETHYLRTVFSDVMWG